MKGREGDSAPNGTAAPARRSVLVALSSLCLCAAVALVAASDVEGRARVERFVSLVGLEARRPLDVASLRLEPAVDLAAAAAIEVELRGRAEPARAPEGWLSAARDLGVDSLRCRPGWPFHAQVLAEIAFRQDALAGAPADARRWMTAWRVAAHGAPGATEVRRRRAEACLEAWPALPAVLRAGAREAISSAFWDSEFVAQSMAAASEVLGVEAAIGLLPDRAEPMRTAAATLADRHIDRAAALLDRAESVERRDRAAAMHRLEDLGRRGRDTAFRDACRDFVATYPPERFDERASRAQTAAVLELWTAQAGEWSTDPRAPLIRFLLERREDSVSPRALRRLLTSLSGIPQPVRAELVLLTSDREAAEKMRGSAAESGARDWVSYDLRAAQDALRRGDPAAALRSLERLPAGERETCEALLARRDVARASSDAAETGAIQRRLDDLRIDSRAGEDGWRRSGRVSLCVDPAAAASQSLSAGLSAAGPAIVAYGFDQGRAGTALVSGERVLAVPLEGRSGSTTFWLTPLAGGAVVRGELSIR